VTEDPASAAPILDEIGKELAEASAELRELARGIHPAVLTERGLAPAISALATRSTVPVEVLDVPEQRLTPSVEATAYFTVAEALTNAVKHARARSAKVRLWRENGRLRIEVRDDGLGGANPNGHGLDGLHKRLAALDGTLAIASPVGGPTVLYAEVPCGS
jgi:signal transduction histidine kinase